MASGDTLAIISPHSNQPPASAFMTFDTRNAHLVLDADDTTAEDAVFPIAIPNNYAGGGITITIIWMATTATSGAVVWRGAWERHDDDVLDLDADSFATAVNSAAATAPSASGETSYDTIAFTNGAQIDGLLVNESGRLLIGRLPADAGDSMVGDAEILRILVRET